MGLKAIAQKGIKKVIGEKTEAQKQSEAKRDAEKIKHEQEIYDIREKAYKRGVAKRAKEAGYNQEDPRSIHQNKSSLNQINSAQPFSVKLGSAMDAFGGSISRTEKIFGLSNTGQLGGNLDFFGNSMGFGFGPPEKKQPPVETVKVSKSGNVTITRPVQPNMQKKKTKQGNPYGWMNDIDDNLLGS